MKWSITIARIRGTDVKLHLTLLLFLGWYAWQGWRSGGWIGAQAQLLLAGLVFLSVLLHEFGHIRAAARYGIPTPDVFLTPIGGVARIARMPETPRQEMVIALAGPAVTLGIVIGLVAGILLTDGVTGLLPGSTTRLTILRITAWINGVLLVFNLIPAFPLDGGRVFRAALATRLGMVRGTRIAARIGQALAIGLAVVGLSYDPILLLIALFIFLGAQAEFNFIRDRESERAGQTANLVDVDVPRFDPWLRLRDIASTLPHSPHTFWPLIDRDGKFHGLLTTEGLQREIATADLARRLGDLLPPPHSDGLVHVAAGKDAAVEQLLASGREALPVIDEENRFVGLLTRERVTDAILTGRVSPTPHEPGALPAGPICSDGT